MNNNNSQSFLMFNNNGTWEKLIDVKNYPDTIPNMAENMAETFSLPEPQISFRLNDIDYDMYGELFSQIVPPSKCKTRKRFIKLLMSVGASRNEAELSAKFYHAMGWSYQKAWMNTVNVGKVLYIV